MTFPCPFCGFDCARPPAGRTYTCTNCGSTFEAGPREESVPEPPKAPTKPCAPDEADAEMERRLETVLRTKHDTLVRREGPPLLQVEGVRAGYGKIEVLKGISLEVYPGEIVAIIGANGAGKTTTLMCISGCNRVRDGRIAFDGREIHRLPAHEIVKLGVCQSPEGRKIFPRLTVRENLEMGAFTRSDGDGVGKDLERAFTLFPILQERQSQAGGTLSGGEQQMLAVARALMGRPKLLLLDEPSLGLAPMIVVKIFDVIRELNQEGMSILLVEQNALMALKLAHRGYVLETGAITMSDRADALLKDERVKNAYLGE